MESFVSLRARGLGALFDLGVLPTGLLRSRELQSLAQSGRRVLFPLKTENLREPAETPN